MTHTQSHGDSAPSERPSFLSFLKKGKGKQKREAGGGGGGDSSNSGNKTNSPQSNNGSPEKQGEQLTKAQVRRAQVRKAQIEHRQRKANYVKQLEMDISQLRELITQAQRDTHTLKSENDDIRAIMGKNGIPTPELTQGQVSEATTSPSEGQATPTQQGAKSPITYPPQEGQEPFLPDSLGTTEEELTVTLSANKTMGTPTLSVSPNSSNSSFFTLSSPATWTNNQIELSPQQELVVVNFVLALEHVCWDHFWVGDCHNHSQQTEQEKGHTLMASSYVMANAPESVYKQREAFTSRFRSSPTLQWQSSPVTLDSLYGLAQCLNPGGEEVAPVQAWFELANRYPIDVLLKPATLVALMRELKGVVRCVAFGAAMEREAFESVVVRVLGPPTGGLQLAE